MVNKLDKKNLDFSQYDIIEQTAVTEDAMKQFKKNNFWEFFKKKMDEQEKQDEAKCKFYDAINEVYKYLKKSCQIVHCPFRLQIFMCLNRCLLPLLRIDPYVLDGSLLYFNGDKLIYTISDLKKILENYPKIPDYEIIDTFGKDFHADIIRSLLCTLFIPYNSYQLNTTEVIDLLKIIFLPNGKIMNPLMINYISSKMDLLRINADFTLQDQFPTKDELKSIKKFNEFPDIVFKSIDTPKENAQKLFYNESLQDFKNVIKFTKQEEKDIFPLINSPLITEIIPKILESTNHKEAVVSNIANFIAKGIMNNYFFMLSLYPLSLNQLKAILYTHQIQFKSMPCYPPTILPLFDVTNQFRCLCKDYLLTTTPTAKETISRNSQWNKQIQEYRRLEKRIEALLNINTGVSYRELNSNIITELHSTQSPFFKIINLIGTITNYDIQQTRNLMILIAKIHLGKNIISNFSDKDNISVNIIRTDNPDYVKNFLLHMICGYSSLHDLNYLCNQENLPYLINEKRKGFLANISCINNVPEITPYFKNLIKGAKVTLSNFLSGKISFQCNLQFVFIIDSKSNVSENFNSVPVNIIDLSGNIHLCSYFNNLVDDYEIYFFDLFAMLYLLDIYTSTPNETEANSESVQSHEKPKNADECIREFYNTFCTNSSDKYPDEKLLKSGIKVDNKYSEHVLPEEAKKLGIDKEPFIYVRELEMLISKWCKAADINNINITDNNVRDFFKPLLNGAFYCRNGAPFTYIDDNVGKQLRGFYCLSVDKDKLNSFILNSNDENNSKNLDMKKRQYFRHMGVFFNDYRTKLRSLLS